MIVHHVTAQPETRLATRLADFESSFSYPLGDAARFSISHGRDYPRFFRAIGRACCVVAEHDDVVIGTLSGAIRLLRTPHGLDHALYIGDLKIRPSARGGVALLRLARALQTWAGPQVHAGYAVVMDGTAMTPERYTGRLGIPAFAAISHVAILRIPSSPGEVSWMVDDAHVAFEALSVGHLTGDHTATGSLLRSHMTPQWLCAPNGGACGRIEDTRLSKRLFFDDGAELCSAHLSAFAWRDADSAVCLLRQAGAIAHALGLPALLVSVMAEQAPNLLAKLGMTGITIAPATVYAHGIVPAPWIIDTAEI